MPRQPRIEYEGAIYHLMNRGNRGEVIVRNDEDRKLFVATLAEACEKCGWLVHAWCLMGNHFHLVVETPLGNLVTGMKWFLGAYTIRSNARHRMRGHLFAGRFKSLLIDERDASYLRVVCDYVHLNPARAGLLKPDEGMEAYPWSSYKSYLLTPTLRPPWLCVERVLGEHGISRDNRSGRLEFSQRMEGRRNGNAEDQEYGKIRSGWRYGSDEFVARTLALVEGKCTESQTWRERDECMEARALRIVENGFKEASWGEGQLRKERKGHPVKVAIARRLRSETTVSLKWIAANLSMGTWTYVSNLLRPAQCQTQGPP